MEIIIPHPHTLAEINQVIKIRQTQHFKNHFEHKNINWFVFNGNQKLLVNIKPLITEYYLKKTTTIKKKSKMKK